MSFNSKIDGIRKSIQANAEQQTLAGSTRRFKPMAKLTICRTKFYPLIMDTEKNRVDYISLKQFKSSRDAVQYASNVLQGKEPGQWS